MILSVDNCDEEGLWEGTNSAVFPCSKVLRVDSGLVAAACELLSLSDDISRVQFSDVVCFCIALLVRDSFGGCALELGMHISTSNDHIIESSMRGYRLILGNWALDST